MTKERVLRTAPIRLICKVIGAVLLFDVFYISLTLFEQFVLDLQDFQFSFLSYSTIAHLSLITLQITTIFQMTVEWYSTRYVIEDNNIIRKKGLIIKKQKVLNYKNLKHTELTQGILGRIFDYGTITFVTAGDKSIFRIVGVESPKKIISLLKNNTQNVTIHTRKQQGITPEETPAQATTPVV